MKFETNVYLGTQALFRVLRQRMFSQQLMRKTQQTASLIRFQEELKEVLTNVSKRFNLINLAHTLTDGLQKTTVLHLEEITSSTRLQLTAK